MDNENRKPFLGLERFFSVSKKGYQEKAQFLAKHAEQEQATNYDFVYTCIIVLKKPFDQK